MSIMQQWKSRVQHPGWCTSSHAEDATSDPIHDGPAEPVVLTHDDWLVEARLSRMDQVVDDTQTAGVPGVVLAFTSWSLVNEAGQPVSATPFLSVADGHRLVEVLTAKLAELAAAEAGDR